MSSPSMIDEAFEKERDVARRYSNDEVFMLEDVYAVFDKWMQITDKGRIDVVLATALTRKMEGTPIWLFLVGPSGDGKSEQVVAINNPNDTVMLHEITPNTLVSGMSDGRHNYDLAPKLKDKLVLIPDMAQLLNLHPNDKAKVWGQMRELYDGRAGKVTGTSDAKYQDIRVTLIACATPSIDAQILIFNHLGTRELIYRTKEEDHDALMDKVMENEKEEEMMKTEIKETIGNYLSNRKLLKIDLPKVIYEKLKTLITYLRFMRATVEADSYSGELRNLVYPEQPTRCLKQFKRMFVALMSLDDGYNEERALKILRHIVKSSSNPMREIVLLDLKKNSNGEHTTSSVANKTKLGKKTVVRELHTLRALGLVEGRIDEYIEKPWASVHYWKINSKGEKIANIMDSDLSVTI